MTTRERWLQLVAEAFSEELGGCVMWDEIHATPVSGYWKSQDVYRVEGWLKFEGRTISYGCWDTMTECVRHGITITHDQFDHYEVHADA